MLRFTVDRSKFSIS